MIKTEIKTRFLGSINDVTFTDPEIHSAMISILTHIENQYRKLFLEEIEFPSQFINDFKTGLTKLGSYRPELSPYFCQEQFTETATFSEPDLSDLQVDFFNYVYLNTLTDSLKNKVYQFETSPIQ